MSPSSVKSETFDFKSATYAEIVFLVDEAVNSIGARGIRFTTGSVLHKLFSDARKLEKQWQSDKSPDLVTGINTVYAEKIARIIIELEHEPGIDEALQRISGADVNLSSRVKSQGKDALWELTLLTALKRKMRKAQLVDPPDIIVDFGMGDYSIACKKIYEPKSFSSRLREGAKQIGKSGNPGLIAVNIDDLLPGHHILVSQTPASALDTLSKAIRKFFDAEQDAFERVRYKPTVDGVMISASTITDIEETRTRLNLTTTFNFFPFPGREEGARRLYALANALSPESSLGGRPPAVNILWPE